MQTKSVSCRNPHTAPLRGAGGGKTGGGSSARLTAGVGVGAAALLAAACCLGAGVREERLANGLHVLVERVPGMPLVSVWSWVRAGSANERPGITGAAHWCEHMAFKGTERYSREEMKELLEREGGAWNGYTWLDQTAYYETLPAGGLALALDIEAQRLSSSLFLAEAVASERSVIISELQMGENDPENLLDIETTAAAIKAHPYRWPTIGWKSDIEAMTRDDLFRFYRNHYAPNNSTVVVTGDVDEDEALARIRETFGRLPRGPETAPLVTEEPAQEGEKRIMIWKGGNTAYLEIAYHAPGAGSADFMPLLALDTILGGEESISLSSVDWRGQASRSSRLYRGLVDAKLAAKAGSLFLPTKHPYLFIAYATAAPGVDLPRLENEVRNIVERASETEITDAEFRKALNQMRARFVYDSESVTGRAHMLGFFDTVGDWRFPGSFLSRVDGLKKEEIAAAARKYLVGPNRTVGWYVPSGSAAAAIPGERRGEARYREGSGASAPAPAAPPEKRGIPSFRGAKKKEAGQGKRGKSAPPPRVALDAVRTTLGNGLTLIVRENHASPSVVARVDVAAGSACDPPGKPGLANFTACMLDKGSTGMSASLLADVLDASGTELEVLCGRERAGVVARMLAEKFPMVMEVLAQLLEHPVFPEKEMEKERGRILTALDEASHDTQQAAEDGAYMGVYAAGHPYGHKVEGDPAGVRSVTRSDLMEFYRAHYRPSGTTIVISGDIDGRSAAALGERLFGGWKAARPLESPTILAPLLPRETLVRKIPVADKTQVDIAVGSRGVARGDPDYYAVQVMNTVLGRFGMGGRLGKNIREDKGLAYYVSSAFVPYRHTGPFMMQAGVNPAHVDEALREMRAELVKMAKKGVTRAELQESKDYIVRSLPRQLETNAQVAAALADIQYYNLGLDYFERFPELIGRVSGRDVLRAAREHLHPDNAVVILAGPVK